MTKSLAILIDDAVVATRRVHAVLAVVTGSPITRELEAVVPCLTSLVGGLSTIDGLAVAASQALPRLQLGLRASTDLLTFLQQVGGQPNQDLDHYGPGRHMDLG